VKSSGERVEGAYGEAETCAEAGGGHQQQGVSERLVVRQERADDQHGHGEQARCETGQVHALDSEAAAQPGTQQRGCDRGHDLGQE
jgi:hypothetical protein